MHALKRHGLCFGGYLLFAVLAGVSAYQASELRERERLRGYWEQDVPLVERTLAVAAQRDHVPVDYNRPHMAVAVVRLRDRACVELSPARGGIGGTFVACYRPNGSLIESYSIGE